MHDDRLAEEIDRLYESFLHTGDLEHFYECLKLACANDIVSQTAIELIKTRFVDDAEGKPAIIVAKTVQRAPNLWHFTPIMSAQSDLRVPLT